MGLFTKDVLMMLRNCGELWDTSIDSECITFYGVFDAENRLETDQSGMSVIIAGSSLVCETLVAKKFTRNHIVTDPDNVDWYVREVLKQDDGFLSRCSLTEKPV